MSKQMVEEAGLSTGQKVLYPHAMHGHGIYMEVVTIKDVILNYDGETVILVNEHEGYLDYSDIYTLDQIKNMIEVHEI